METTVIKFRRYVELTGVSMQELAKKTNLNWLTIRKVIHQNGNVSVTTIMKLNYFLDSIQKEIKDL